MEEVAPLVAGSNIARPSRAIRFTQALSYLIAAGLMVLAISQLRQIADLKAELLAAHADQAHLRQSNAMVNLRLVPLDAHDAAYAAGKVLIAWDPYRHCGVVSIKDLPAPPVGQNYQLWVLDPKALAPVNAGLLTASRPFAVGPTGTEDPGFAVTLEPSTGGPALTGPILFAVAPGS